MEAQGARSTRRQLAGDTSSYHTAMQAEEGRGSDTRAITVVRQKHRVSAFTLLGVNQCHLDSISQGVSVTMPTWRIDVLAR